MSCTADTAARSTTDEAYIGFDPFSGEEADLSLRTVTLRKARKPHQCFLSMTGGRQQHDIQPGQRYREERALVDGSFFGRYRMCLACIDLELATQEDDE